MSTASTSCIVLAYTGHSTRLFHVPACTSAWNLRQATTLPNQAFRAPIRMSSGSLTLLTALIAARSVRGTPSSLSMTSILRRQQC